MKMIFLFFSLLIVMQFAGCTSAPAPQAPKAVRLITLFKPEQVQDKAKQIQVPRTEWRFEKGDQGWKTVSGISDLTIKNGKLAGRTTSDIPLLHYERKDGLENNDTLHSMEIRLRASEGTNLIMAFQGSEKLNVEQALGVIRDLRSVLDSSPILPGPQIQTYTLKPKLPQLSSDIRHILIVPTDRKNTTFEMESVRLIFRKEYLAGVPSGVSWQAMKGIYHETIASRSPETIRMSLKLPPRPRLDLNLGTIEDGPVTFRIKLLGGATENVLLERTLTRPHRWEPVPLDLPANLGGTNVTLALSVKAETEGAVGFWGSPTVRSRNAPTGSAHLPKAPSAVILIWVDTIRRDHLEPYGYKRSTSPQLQRMAEEGVLFRDCVSQATWTKVASPSLVTSLYPATHGVIEFTNRLPASATTLAEVFQQAGYATIGFSSNLFTATFSNFQQGFEQLHEDSSLANPSSSKTTREYMDRLLPWIERHRDVPFFVFMHAYDPHDPYEPYAPYNTMWADPAKKEEHEKQLAAARKIISHPLLRLFGMPTRKEMIQAGFDPDAYVAYDRGWYDGSIRAMDSEVGRLLEYLRNHKMDENTLVVFAGDHGEEFLEHGRMFHGQTVYGELTNVPLIFWGTDAVPSKHIVEDTVETIDVMPTILEICGLRSPDGTQGESFVSLLRELPKESSHATANSWNQKPAFSEKSITQDKNAPPPHDTESFAVVLERWKLIHNTKRPQDAAEYELYDHRKDSLNYTNVASDHADVVRQLSKLLQDWRASTTKARLKPDSEASKSLSQEELERLRSLGYIQ